MLTFERPLLLLLILPIGLLVYLTWKHMSLPYALRQRRLILFTRLLLFTLIIAALAGITIAFPVNKQTTIFVGDLSASTTQQRTFIEQWIGQALQHKRPDDQIGIVATGRNALVEQSISTHPDFSHFESTPDTNYTDLSAGLRLAAAILPTDSERHIILLTDGQQNLGDALQEAQLLQQQNIRLDIVPLPTSQGAEARIDGLDTPTQLRVNERFTLHIKLYSTVAQNANLRIYLDKSLLVQQKIHLGVGQQETSLSLLAPPPGFHTFHVTLDAPQDTILQNNEASAFVNVQGPPHVLLIEGKPDSGHNIQAALQATKIDVTTGSPNEVPTTLEELAPYSAVVLADVPAVSLGNARMQTLQAFVRDLGHGLIVSGGQNSYGIGGYANTPLEQTLPVRMDIPQHKDTPSIAVVLIIESLESSQPINISKEAAKSVVSLLTPRDQVGVSAGYGTLTSPMQHVTNKAAINKTIDSMNPLDPTSYTPDLVNAEHVLQQTDAKIKHVILLGDGDAFDTYNAQVTKMAKEDITVSTVATNSDSDQELGTMQEIANAGKGRFYRADDPATIPQILLQETEQAAKRSIVNESFEPITIGAHPILTGLNGLPTLDGYVATTPKPDAQMVLVSHRDDPVLATWQYGLGRVAAWTSDAQGLWTAHWLTWNDAARWWANLVTWTLPSPDSAMNINGQMNNGKGQLAVDLPASINPSGSQQMQAHIIAPDHSQESIALQPTAPQHWEGNFAASQVGAYLIQVSWQETGGSAQNRLTATTGMVVPYSPEYRAQGTDMHFLSLIAQAGKGSLLHASDPATAFTQPLSPVSQETPIAFWLLILAALLLPLDIAARRLSSLEFLVLSRKWLIRRLHLRGARSQQDTEGVASSTTPALAPLADIRIQRKQRHQVITRSPGPPTQHNGSTPPIDTTKKATATSVAPKPSAQTSTTETLLAAKRKRQARNGDKGEAE